MGRTYIVIDNDADDLEVLESTLKHADPEASCISFIFPDQAVDAIENHFTSAPDFVFIDVNMTRMTGQECLFRLKHLRRAGTKIIMFSSVMPKAVGEAFRENGAYDFFQKPLLESEYRSVIKAILSRTGKRVEITGSHQFFP